MPHCSYKFGCELRSVDDPMLADVLVQAYRQNERPRCMCVPGGVEMYIAKHRQFVIKRMPGTGPQHHPSCDSYEPEPSDSGRGAMVGNAILATGPDSFDLHVDFPLTRAAGRSRPGSHGEYRTDVSAPAQRMSLQALMHFLFEQAGFHRWAPAMAGRRHQGVIHKYLIEAALDIRVKGPVGRSNSPTSGHPKFPHPVTV
jgi:hypothetical protein